MNRFRVRSLAGLLLTVTGCIETTGGRLVTFEALAGGDPEVVNGGPLQFSTPLGYHVTLTRAQFTVGALYFNQQNPSSYTLEPSCIQPGIYTGEVRGRVTIDALSPEAQPFPVPGVGSDLPTRGAELWLTGGELLAEDDATVLLDVAGTATRGADVFPFDGQLTIGRNRTIPPRSPALPGSNPLCRQRIVGPVDFETRLAEGSRVSLVDPRAWFGAVEFGELTRVSDSPLTYRFVDTLSSSAQPDKALYNALRSATGPYRLTQQNP